MDTPDLRRSLPAIHRAVTDWFAAEARDLPWRLPECTPWGVLVSEVMLQQTPVVRVLPVWEDWMSRWPAPADLAAEPAGEAVRHWGRLGYPRRALRLHAAAAAITADHNGEVPAEYERLLSLPGVGSYTAAAVAAFAYGRRQTVVDTNIRRVHARLFTGTALPAQALTAAEMRLATELLPDDAGLSVRWNAAVMELGAVVCTARAPKCADCPVRAECAWRLAGEPPPSYVPKGQAWHGTDRQVRGAVMAVLREADSPVTAELFLTPPADLGLAPEGISVPLGALHRLSAPVEQLDRALQGLLADGLAEMSEAGYRLPS
ncbi:A/G-specific adenine glycosylase [Pseudarthrobacter sp. J75]|uniref:A/G-specific adenine glycosylase n=1 Tax=unclassified Pseudarthrobacter TaxID=2647000 RepID=UPI002E80907E|nr:MULTISPECIES: A/G-specific adenine glycosylase [unclassified Pseudarthrobacter]MEE2521982.1 A/G-specific adenine glycosylase [Pseudarthrobacter sp. J47]MEE2528907.1 A/G-specific adenine glycosylase [Pseudarthrobacter sp. J75]